MKVPSWSPVRGKYRYALDRTDFYIRSGRADLARSQSARDTTSDALFYGGALTALAGLAFPLILGGNHVSDTDVLLGVEVFAGGIVVSGVGAAMSGPVVDSPEAALLAKRYNDALERRVLSRSLSSPLAPSPDLGVACAITF